MAVGGGGSSGFIVYATFDESTFHQLVNPVEPEDETITVVAGAQPGTYPRRHLVSVEAALHAAQVFATTGRLAEDLTWTES